MAEYTHLISSLPQKFVRKILTAVIANMLPQTLSAHRISVPILREEEHSTAHFH